jgi:hypothetical protein
VLVVNASMKQWYYTILGNRAISKVERGPYTHTPAWSRPSHPSKGQMGQNCTRTRAMQVMLTLSHTGRQTIVNTKSSKAIVYVYTPPGHYVD